MNNGKVKEGGHKAPLCLNPAATSAPRADVLRGSAPLLPALLCAALLAAPVCVFGQDAAGKATLPPAGTGVQAPSLPPDQAGPDTSPALPYTLWDKYADKASMVSSGVKSAPGRLPANAAPYLSELFYQNWRCRAITYEIYYPNQRVLARAVLGLAAHAGDVDKNIDAERFYRSVQGFRYSPKQICAWLNDADAGRGPAPDSSAAILISWLAEDGVLVKDASGWRPAGEIAHVLGASRDKKRPLERNLAHERAHVLWKEKPEMRRAYREAWAALSPEEQEGAVHRLSGYSRKPELLLEEWAVRQEETKFQTMRPRAPY